MFAETKIFVPVGHLIAYPTITAPTGYLKCNGAAVSRTSYASLFSVLGTKYGIGDGSSTFNLPDLRGEFIRGYDDGRGIDDIGRAFETAQSKQANHLSYAETSTSNLNDNVDVPLDGTGVWFRYQRGSYVSGIRFRNSTDDINPRNIALLMCIKY
jgi:phage-related tail fiber protein